MGGEAGHERHTQAPRQEPGILRPDRSCRAIAEAAKPTTVRGIAYKLFTLGMIPDMSRSQTNRVAAQLMWAREQGVIAWTWIVDETRRAERVSRWADPDQIIDAAVQGYRRDYWQRPTPPRRGVV